MDRDSHSGVVELVTGLSHSSACMEMSPRLAALCMAALRLRLKIPAAPTLQLREGVKQK
jgi:hypothetical protein